MRCRGVISIIILFIFLIGSTPAHAINTPHENFSEADEDLFAIISFLADTKDLCEKALQASISANCTLWFNESITITYNEYQLNTSLKIANDLQKKISYSTDILDKIEDKAGSYEHLNAFLLPIKKLGNNVTSITKNHETIVQTFQNLSIAVNNQASFNITILQQITKAHNTLQNLWKDFDSIEIILNEISPFFSVDNINNTIKDFNHILNQYEHYFTLLMDYFPSNEPQLILIIEETDVYLGNDISITGYFIAGNKFISNHEINIEYDNEIIESSLTNKFGRYEESITTQPTDNPGMHSITTSTYFNGTEYTSEKIHITLHKIPTKLKLTIPKNQYQPQTPITFSGKLSTHSNKGIRDKILLRYNEINKTIITNSSGNFTYTISTNLSYGSYTIDATYNPEKIYNPCISNTLHFDINEPTKLTIISNIKNIHNGELLAINGTLQNEITSDPISGKTIQIYVNGKPSKVAITDREGNYNISWKTDNISAGPGFIYSKYISDDNQWRSCTSNTINIYVFSKTESQINILFPILISLIIILSLILYIFRRYYYIRPSKKEKYPTSSHPFLSKSTINKSFISKKESAKKPDNINLTLTLKQKIITQYRLLLRYLSSNGIHFRPNYTHVDIKNLLKTVESKKEVVDSVTTTFEHARYSHHPAQEEDVEKFDKNILSLITEFRK